MIDIHNHILHDMDDGPLTIEKSLDMARQSVSVGTTIMLATPHRYITGRQARPELVRERVDLLNVRLTAENIPLTIVAGVEIPIDFGIAQEIRKGNLSTLGGGNYVLIEPPFPNLPAHILPAVKELLSTGYNAVLAHPERNALVQRNWVQEKSLRFVSACADMGCVLQLTSGSILGKFGPSALATAKAIALHRDWQIVIASDSHDPKDRTPGLLAEARDTVAQWISDAAAAEKMVLGLPAQIISQ